MEVIGISNLRICKVVYCTSPEYRNEDVRYAPEEEELFEGNLTLVTDPEKEFAKCHEWEQRLTPYQRMQLESQRKPKPETREENDMPGKLYQTLEAEPRFGELIATNSEGLFVLEMKGTGGKVETFAPTSVERVHPYTVAVTFIGSNSQNKERSKYHYLARKGDVEKGDLILMGRFLVEVVGLDTKSSMATVQLTGRKIVTIPLDESTATPSVAMKAPMVDIENDDEDIPTFQVEDEE